MENKKWYDVPIAVVFNILVILVAPFFFLYGLIAKIIEKILTKITKSDWCNYSVDYEKPDDPLPDEEFIKRIDEFMCIQFYVSNGYSGYACLRELVASKRPGKKKKILKFLQKHPIEKLLEAEFHQDGFDMSHWKIKFIFEDKRLNRSYSGYGFDETTSLYINGIMRHVPRVLLRLPKRD